MVYVIINLENSMSMQDNIYDVEAEVKGTDAEEAFEKVVRWAGLMESDLELLLGRYNILIEAFKLIKNNEEVTKEFDALDEKLKNK